MVGEVPVRFCLDELRDNTEPGAARVVPRERGSALLGTTGVPSGLVDVAVDGQDGDPERRLELFEALVQLARMDDESRGRLRARFLQEAAMSNEAPAALVKRLMGQNVPLREIGQLPFDPDTEIDALWPVASLAHGEPGDLDTRIDLAGC